MATKITIPVERLERLRDAARDYAREHSGDQLLANYADGLADAFRYLLDPDAPIDGVTREALGLNP